ncbi:MAG TPA: sigma 54-interacting transcriptional regulator [Bacteroidia bacterium]|nr:sigma 54-interacting transcriptional regulator [Bacteroidia bacterium]
MQSSFAQKHFWIENFSDSTYELERISESLKDLLLNFKSHDPALPLKSGIILFDNETPIEKLNSFARSKLNSGCPNILAIAVKVKDIDKSTYWSLFREGVADVLCWENLFSANEVVANIIERWLTIERLLASAKVKNMLIGNSERWQRSLREIVEVALFSSSSVLITGESGTGKELVSHLIHELDNRSEKGQMTLVDCTTIVPELSGSEFFGHERGAFTNAVSSRDGAFSLAHKGTLFLDEVGELPAALQAELLRVIQEGTYKRIGSNIWKQTNFRLVSATNRNLLNDVKEQRFRQDLYFRISGWVIELPPLRERSADIPLLADHFLKRALKTEDPVEMDHNLIDYLMIRNYSGNIRELKQLMSRLALKYTGKGPLTLGLLPKDELGSLHDKITDKTNTSLHDAVRKIMLEGASLKEMKELVGNIAIQIAIEQESGNLQRAASKLGLTDRTLQLWKSKSNGNEKNNYEHLT